MIRPVIETVTDLGWSAVGLVVGYILGLLTRVAIGEAALTPDRKEWLRRALGAVLLVAAVIAGTQVYAAQRSLTAQAECEADYTQTFNRALTARLEATENERVAQRELLTTILTRQGSSGALRQYLATLDRLEQARRDNPLPTRPDCDGDR